MSVDFEDVLFGHIGKGVRHIDKSGWSDSIDQIMTIKGNPYESLESKLRNSGVTDVDSETSINMLRLESVSALLSNIESRLRFGLSEYIFNVGRKELQFTGFLNLLKFLLDKTDRCVDSYMYYSFFFDNTSILLCKEDELSKLF